MIKKLAIILFSILLLFSSCKSNAKAKTTEQEKPSPEIVETETSKAEVSKSSVGQRADEKKAQVKKPEKLKRPTQKKPATEPKEKQIPKKLAQQDTKKIEPKLNPAKGPAELAVKKAQSLSDNCKKLSIDKAFPTEFASASKDLNNAENSAKGNKYAEAKKQAETASQKFQTLLNLNEAGTSKNSIIENKFEGADAKTFSEAEIAYINALESFDKNSATALKQSKTATTAYASVLEKGYIQWTNIAMEAATKAKANCDSIKASKSASEEYKQADTLFKNAKSQQSKKAYAEAHKSYISSATLFTSIYDKVSVLREEALKAMKKASSQQEISSDLAAEADAIIPLKAEKKEEASKTETLPIIENAPEDAGLQE